MKGIKYMLIDDIVDFCNKKYITFGDKCGNSECTHPTGECSGSCYDCLYEIHYFDGDKCKHKSLYDCPKMLYHYVCQYTLRYASEILYALKEEGSFLSGFETINMMSIGCGGCPDLMAMEKLLYDDGMTIPLAYKGYDVNPLWLPVHNRVQRYCKDNDIVTDIKFKREDAINYFSKFYSKNTNVIVISYLISYLYNTPQKKEILDFFDRLIDNVIVRNKDKKLIIFNDVNSCNRGRDYFGVFVEKLREKGLHGSYRYTYFDSDRLNKYQRNGDAYNASCSLFSYDKAIERKYHVDGYCRSAQLIVEVDQIDN